MVNENEPDASKLEMAKMTDTIANLSETVGTIQAELSKVSSSVDSHVSEIKKMFETMMGKPKGPEDSLEVSDEVSRKRTLLFRTLPKWRPTLLRPGRKSRKGPSVRRIPKAPSLQRLMFRGIIQEFHHLKVIIPYTPLSPCHTFLMPDLLPCLTLMSFLIGSLKWSLIFPDLAPLYGEALFMDFILMMQAI